jgi:hypothetical protein
MQWLRKEMRSAFILQHGGFQSGGKKEKDCYYAEVFLNAPVLVSEENQDKALLFSHSLRNKNGFSLLSTLRS